MVGLHYVEFMDAHTTHDDDGTTLALLLLSTSHNKQQHVSI